MQQRLTIHKINNTKTKESKILISILASNLVVIRVDIHSRPQTLNTIFTANTDSEYEATIPVITERYGNKTYVITAIHLLHAIVKVVNRTNERGEILYVQFNLQLRYCDSCQLNMKIGRHICV